MTYSLEKSFSRYFLRFLALRVRSDLEIKMIVSPCGWRGETFGASYVWHSGAEWDRRTKLDRTTGAEQRGIPDGRHPGWR